MTFPGNAAPETARVSPTETMLRSQSPVWNFPGLTHQEFVQESFSPKGFVNKSFSGIIFLFCLPSSYALFKTMFKFCPTGPPLPAQSHTLVSTIPPNTSDDELALPRTSICPPGLEHIHRRCRVSREPVNLLVFIPPSNPLTCTFGFPQHSFLRHFQCGFVGAQTRFLTSSYGPLLWDLFLLPLIGGFQKCKSDTITTPCLKSCIIAYLPRDKLKPRAWHTSIFKRGSLPTFLAIPSAFHKTELFHDRLCPHLGCSASKTLPHHLVPLAFYLYHSAFYFIFSPILFYLLFQLNLVSS